MKSQALINRVSGQRSVESLHLYNGLVEDARSRESAVSDDLLVAEYGVKWREAAQHTGALDAEECDYLPILRERISDLRLELATVQVSIKRLETQIANKHRQHMKVAFRGYE